jgi:DNA polymerase-1
MKGAFGSEEKFDLVVVDFMNRFKIYEWTMRNLHDSKGRFTGIYYGILDFVHERRKEFEAPIIFAQDRKPEYKLSINSTYKANRKKEKDLDFLKRIKVTQNLLSLYNIRQFFVEGYEADDVAASLVKKHQDKKILLVSNDNDWFELLKFENVRIFKDNKIWNREEIEKKYERNVENQTLIKAIVGEKKENVEGIKRFPRKLLNNVFNNPVNKINIKNMFDSERWSPFVESKSEEKWIDKVFENKEKIEENFKLKSLVYDLGDRFKKIKRINDKKKFFKAIKGFEMEKLYEKIKGQ